MSKKLKTSLNCPVISTEVRNFPVSVQYHHPDRHKKIWEFAAQHAKKLMSSIEGSLLIFMPGKYEINKTINELSKFHPRSKILALHGQLPTSEQDRVIKNAENNRIIVATNIAETSLTIPGITAVIDSGTIKQSSYDSSRQLTTLYTQPISTSSADQRAGRAGRIAPGQCIRLWSKSEQNRRPSHFEPEILRCDPAELLLQSYAHGYPDPKLLPLLDLPSHFERATDTLKSLGFLNQNLTLSAAGQCAATMPCSPRLAAVLYYGTQADQMIKACAYAALISEPSIILSKVKKNISDLALHENKTYSSDLDILHELLSLARDLKFNPDSCTKYSLNANNCRNVNLARQQFLNICESLPRLHDFNDMHPHCCLLRAFRDRIAKRRDSGSLQVDLSEDRKGEIERLSSQKKSEIILAAEIAALRSHGMVLQV